MMMNAVVLAVEPKAYIASASLAIPSFAIDRQSRDATLMENRDRSNITRLLMMMNAVVLAVEPKAYIASASLAIPSFAIDRRSSDATLMENRDMSNTTS